VSDKPSRKNVLDFYKEIYEQRFKGQAGMGGRGKNQERNRQDKKTRTSKRKPGGGANLTRPSVRTKDNQGRNQKQWAAKKKMASRY
jgi:hypothetical protein